MVEQESLYENKKVVAIVIIVALSVALLAMFSTIPVGQAWLGIIARGIMP